MSNKRKCKMCGWEWTIRKAKEPAACPACKSYKWNKGKSNATVNNNKEQ